MSPLLPTCQVLWECINRFPNLPRGCEAICSIMQRAADSEEQMRKLVVSVCSEIWFTPGAAVGEGARLYSRGCSGRGG